MSVADQIDELRFDAAVDDLRNQGIEVVIESTSLFTLVDRDNDRVLGFANGIDELESKVDAIILGYDPR